MSENNKTQNKSIVQGDVTELDESVVFQNTQPKDEPTFKLEIFEGPLELLLSLIAKNKVSIYDIPIALILDQYMEVFQNLQNVRAVK